MKSIFFVLLFPSKRKSCEPTPINFSYLYAKYLHIDDPYQRFQCTILSRKKSEHLAVELERSRGTLYLSALYFINHV